MMRQALVHTSLRVAMVVALAMSSSGCQLIGDIFKAGVWVGVLAVVLVIAVAVGVVGFFTRR